MQAIREIRQNVESIEERIARLRSAMETGARQLKLAPGKSTYDHDRLAASMGKLMDLEKELIEKTIQLEGGIRAAEDMLAALPPQQRIIMRLRYVDGLPLRLVAKKSHYSARHCIRIEKAALRRLGSGSI